jgi:hypothetical protein
VSKKQTSVANSTAEAELVSANHAVRVEGLPTAAVWETIAGGNLQLRLKEDNEATARILRTGRNPTLRYANRTHKVSLAWLHEQFQYNHYYIDVVGTKSMCADIFTKHFTTKELCHHACSLINHVTDKQSPAVPAVISPSWNGGCSVAAPAPTAPPHRRLIEFCCGHDSLLSTKSPATTNCECIRKTIDDDVTTEKGLNKVLQHLKPTNHCFFGLACHAQAGRLGNALTPSVRGVKLIRENI